MEVRLLRLPRSMQPPPARPAPTSRFHGSTIFAVVAVLTLGSTIAATGLGRRPRGKLEAARADINAECMQLVSASRTSASASRTPDPCVIDARLAPVVPELNLAKVDAADADAALRDGDQERAALALVRILDRADRLDRQRTLIGALVTSKLYDGVADRVDTRPSLLDEPRLATALRRSRFTSARGPLEAERLHALSVLANAPSQAPLPSAGFAEATAYQAMRDVDRKLEAMQAAVLRHDVPACEVAARTASGLARQGAPGEGVCRIAAGIVTSGDRLAALRTRAAVSAERSHATTARITNGDRFTRRP